MAVIVPPPAAAEDAPTPAAERIDDEYVRSECLEAWTLAANGCALWIIYAHHPQDAYQELQDVYGIAKDVVVDLARTPGADHNQPEGPTLDDMLDRLKLYGPCRQCGCRVDEERQHGARTLDPRYYKPLGALFCSPEHKDAYLKRWRKSHH